MIIFYFFKLCKHFVYYNILIFQYKQKLESLRPRPKVKLLIKINDVCKSSTTKQITNHHSLGS